MSFITRCPACATAFKVVSDQLKISEGWVRCGHCQHVFDATLDLQPWWPGAEPVTLPASPPAQEAAPAALVPTAEKPPQAAAGRVWAPLSAAPSEPEAAPSPEHGSAPALESEPEPARAPESDPYAALLPEVEPEPASAHAREPEPQPAPLPESEPDPKPVPAEPMAAEAEPGWEPAAATPAPDTDFQPSFVQQAQRRALWRRPAVRWALAAALAVLLLLLGLQASLHWRDDLAARVPEAEPALTTLCAPLDCEVAPPRQLENVLIDSSVLLRRAPGRYTFNLVVRNAAAMEVAAPALELTLTDIHDQVLVRRVIPAEAWPQPRTTLAPGAEWPVQFELELASPEAQVMTGYRAILFYP